MYQNLSGCHTTAQNQMSEIACVLHLSIIGNISFLKNSRTQVRNIGHILMHQFTVIRSKMS